MRHILLVIRRELFERLNARSFRLFTIGLFLLAAGAIIALDQASNVFGESEFEVGIAGEAPPGFEPTLEQLAEGQDVSVRLRDVAGREDAEALLREGEIDAFLLDQRLFYESSEAPTLTTLINRALFASRLPQMLEAAGLSLEEAEALLDPEPAEVTILDEEDTSEVDRRLIGFLAALSLYITLAFYGNWILTGVIEEKSTRIVEVLLGLLRPYELLTGKTIGIVLVAVGQLLAAVAGAVVGVFIVGSDILPEVALDVVLASIPLFVAGVLLYSLIYAAIGATVTRQADAQTASTPIVVLLLVPYMYASVFVPDNPDGPAATILSLFPLTSPLIMPSRVAMGSPSVLELVACYALLLPAIALVAWMGGRVYSAAIMSGRNLTLPRLISALRRQDVT